MENKDQPAFPVTVKYDESGKAIGYQNGSETGQEIGLSKREMIAAMCLQGLCASDFRGSMEAFARKSVEAADALLVELSKS